MPMNPEFEEQHLRRQKKRDIKKNREGRSLWMMFIVWSARTVLVLALLAFGIGLSIFVSGSDIFDLTEVQVLGYNHVNAAEIQRVLAQEFPRKLYRIQLQKVREFVEAQPWVWSCQVRRAYPNKLKVLVVERRPVALAKIEGELLLVDRSGVILETYGSRFKHLDLPVIGGLDNSTQEDVSAANQAKMDTVMRVLTDLNSGSERLSDRISEIDVTDPNRVALVPLDQPIKVFVGDSNFRERYRTYLSRLSLMADLTAKYGALDSVDLSVEHKIIFHTKAGNDPGIDVKDDQPG